MLNLSFYTPPFGGSWSAFGGGAAGINIGETDFYILNITSNAECTSKNAWASAEKGIIGPQAQIVLAAGDAIYMWGTHLVPNEMDTKANGGLFLIIGSGTSDYHEYYIGGGDTLIYDDRWVCVPIDPDNSLALWNKTVGTPSTTVFDRFGVGADLPAGGPSKGAPLGIGGVRHGKALTVEDGQASAYGTFQGAADYNDEVSRRFGQFQSSSGSFKMQCQFEFGSAGTSVDFRDSNVAIFITPSEFVPNAFNRFEVNHASSKVLLTAVSVTSLSTQSPGYWVNNADADVDLIACSFINMADFDFDAATVVDSCLFQSCGQISPLGADLSGTTVNGYTGAANTSAVLWDETTDPDDNMTDMEFVMGANDTHAIEFGDTIPSEITLTGCSFTGYDSSTAAPANVNDAMFHFKDTSGTITLNLVGCSHDGTVFTYRTDGATIILVEDPVTILVHAGTVDNVDVENARVMLRALDATGPFPFEETVTSIVNSGTTATVVHTTHGMATGDKVQISGASLTANNGIFAITVTGVSGYTYTMGSSPGSSPTGTIKSTFVAIEGLTDSNGDITTSRVYPSAQPITGWARLSTSPPYYKTAPIAGEVSSTLGLSTIAVMILDQ